MQSRQFIIAAGIVALGVIATVTYFWVSGPSSISPAELSGPPLATPSGDTPGQSDTNFGKPEGTPERLETIVSDIEQNAGGDDTALERELAGESERFSAGTGVMEQLGQSYAEISN